ncbi:hypothetical protein BKG71_19420 [Mycobacteroides chelonae]|uniref:hypothetical protein n=1 Tax=Mycobacteroides chelonae TaxID=1774 RepID=UPI0008AA481B|nr:hypothetical protein [Mycobacteroides chelonae]OHT98289.1 hypothetical protein BKG71_19420 [Mycobacteroides chelonae]
MPVIRRAAKSVAFQWPGILDKDDAEQGIATKLLESPGSLEKIAGMDDKARYRAVVGIGHQIASQERDDLDQFRGNFNYSVNDVKLLLSKGVLIERITDDFHCAQFDLEQALPAIADSYFEAIQRRYYDNEPTADDSAYGSALSRGLTALTTEMNRSYKRRYAERDDGPGTRHAVSSAAARALSSSQYDGKFEFEGYNNPTRVAEGRA